jgi:hypothetical protein
MNFGIQFRINDITPMAVTQAAITALVDNPGFTRLESPVMVDLSATVYKRVKVPDLLDHHSFINALVGTIINSPAQVKKLTISKAYTNTQTMLYLLSVRPMENDPCPQP